MNHTTIVKKRLLTHRTVDSPQEVRMFHSLRAAFILVMLAGALLIPSTALAGERVLQFRSQEDPSLSGDTAACPYPNRNLTLRARLFGYDLDGRTGLVKVDEDPPQYGTAFACGVITSLSPGSEASFYIEFNFAQHGTYAADGKCLAVSNNVPVGGLILVGCALKLVSAPSGVLGGLATSNSVFNPFHLSGFDTGSYWTIRAYTSS
jgi:hypothetical protein